MAHRNRRSLGSSLIELACGALIVIPIMIVLVDLGIIILANNAIDRVCKESARAAGSAVAANSINNMYGSSGNSNVAYSTAKQVAQNMAGNSGYMQNVKVHFFAYHDNSGNHTFGSTTGGVSSDPGLGNCRVIIAMDVHVPVNLPGFTQKTMYSSAVSPITADDPR